jgi:hypothetical protein
MMEARSRNLNERVETGCVYKCAGVESRTATSKDPTLERKKHPLPLRKPFKPIEGLSS